MYVQCARHIVTKIGTDRHAPDVTRATDSSARGVRAQFGRTAHVAARRRSRHARREASRTLCTRLRSRVREGRPVGGAARRKTCVTTNDLRVGDDAGGRTTQRERSKRSVCHRQRLTRASTSECVLSCAFSGRESRRCRSLAEERFSCALGGTRLWGGNDRWQARVRSTAIRMRLGRGTPLRREPAQPGREVVALTGRDTRRGHHGGGGDGGGGGGTSLSRRKSAINTRIYTISHKATEENIVMDTNSRRESSKNIKACSKSQHLEDIKSEDNNKLEDVFPWLSKFSKDIRSSTGSKNYQHLEQLLSFYTQNILSSVAEGTVKFNDKINLKNHINKMLIFFHLYWLDVRQDIADHSQYLNKISALLNVYIDIELQTPMEDEISSHVRDSKIAAKILAALYIYLNNSEEHIFRILLRIEHTTDYTNICNHIFTKIFTNLKTRTSITDVAYIRCVLAFRMWRKMQETTKKNSVPSNLMFSERKKEISPDKLAIKLLGPRMPKLQDELLKFVPRPPMDQVIMDLETQWLIQSNLFDEKQVHKQFLLFEDKMNNSTDLQCTKTINVDQSYSKIQKHQMNSLDESRSNSNGDTSQQKINKCLVGLRNNNMLSNDENILIKFLDQTGLQKRGSKRLKSLKKIRKKPRQKPEVIDLTGDEIKILYKVKRKKNLERNSEYLSRMKNNFSLMRNNKRINPLKYSSKSTNANDKECSNEKNKSLKIKIHSECKPIDDIKISDTENCISVSTRFSLNDVCHINLKKNEHSNVIKNQMGNTCLEFAKEDEKQHDYNLHYLKSPMFVDQNTKEFKVTSNVLKESKLENCVSSYVTIGNATSFYDNSITQNKEALTSQEESAMETIPLFKTCQNNIADQHSFKQELPTSTDCSAMQKSHKCNCNTIPVDVHDIKHLIIKKLKSINDHSSQITEIIKQEVCHQVNECPNCYTKIDCKPFRFTNNDITSAKAQGTLHNTFNDNENDIKLACDTNIIYTLRDCNKCVYVVNHIDERVMLHAEKRVQCLDKSNDTCTVSTTFTEDQIAEPSLHNQHVNFDNVKMNDYDNVAKYSETMMKEQQQSDCDSSILNDQLHSSESCISDINNSFNIGSNTEVDYDLKSFPKEEADEITKTDYVDNLEPINFLNNIQSETVLEDFFWQSSEQPQINYDNLTKKPLMYTDNDITTVKQDSLHNIFNDDENDVKTPYDTNIIYMLSDRDKCIYVTNTGEHITSAEKRMQCLNNSNDTCTVSTTFTGDQIVKSPLDSQQVNFDKRKKYDYEFAKYFEDDTMKEQGRSDCDTSMSNKPLHSSELCTFDIDSFEIDSKEASEILKTDYINDFENISFLHNIQTETLEDILSNDTTNFLPLKQSLFELDNVYTDTSLNKKNVLCNNQNDAIDSSIDVVPSHLYADDTLPRLPAKSDKPMFQGTMEFRYSS